MVYKRSYTRPSKVVILVIKERIFHQRCNRKMYYERSDHLGLGDEMLKGININEWNI